MIIYKIRTKDGLFSRGGCEIDGTSFSKRGKIWKRQSDLTLHLAQLDANSLRVYENVGAEVVEYEVTEREVSLKRIDQYLTEIQARKEVREKQRRESIERFNKTKELQQMNRLVQKYGFDLVKKS